MSWSKVLKSTLVTDVYVPGHIVVLGKFGLCLKPLSGTEGLEWSVCFEILEPPSIVIVDGGSKISKQTNNVKPSVSLNGLGSRPNFPNTNTSH
jgi:hypothetical protein